MTGVRDRWWLRASAADARVLAEAIAVVVVTWLALGWRFTSISHADGTVQWLPYLKSSLAAGADWQDHVYRIGVLGGAAMHDAAGTLPLTTVSACLGLSAETASFVETMFLQVAFAFCASIAGRGLYRAFRRDDASLPAIARIAIVWVAAFAPWLGWRVGWGHDNLLLGMLPFVAASSLVVAARGEVPSPVALVVTALLVWSGLVALGAQMIVYGVVFGAPLLVALALVDGPRPRWSRAQLAIAVALAAGVFLALPRAAGMIAYVVGDDFPRSGPLIDQIVGPSARDWLGIFALAVHGDHETNYSLGPLVIVAIGCWPRDRSRAPLYALLAVTVVAVLYAADVGPVASLVRALPAMSSFRIPARALLIGWTIVPALALAGFAAGTRAPDRRTMLVALGAALVVLVAGAHVPAGVVEALAWLASIAVVVSAHKPRFATAGPIALAVLCALGAVAFAARIPGVPHEPIDGGPAALRATLLKRAPELADPLVRVELKHAPSPYEMSTAFAAGLPTLDGAWYPTRRFLDLLSALRGEPMPATAGVFDMTRYSFFPLLVDLYDVHYVLDMGHAQPVLTARPGEIRKAWLPQEIVRVDAASEVGEALRHGASTSKTAWVLIGDAHPDLPDRCTGSLVDAHSDARGQSVSVTVDLATPCLVVVATNVVAAMHARSDVGELPVIPVDIALAGIIAPAGRHTITLAPEPFVPGWARAGSLLGLLALAGAIALAIRAARSVP